MRIILGLIIVLLAQIGWKGDEKMPLSREVCEAIVDTTGGRYYDAKFAFYPALATSKGIHTYDGRLSTFSQGRIHRFLVRTKRMQERLGKIWEDSLSLEKWVDYKALLADMTTQVFLIEELETYRSWPTLYADACVQGVYSLLVRPDVSGIDTSLAGRLKEIPEVVRHARKNLTRPSRLHCRIASRSIRDFRPFLADLAGGPSGPHFDPVLLRSAMTSLEGFAEYLDSLALDADPDFALGYDNFTKLLAMQHMIYDSPEDLIGYAEQVLARAREKRERTARSMETKVDTAGAGSLTPEDIVNYYKAEIESARAFVERRNLMDLPDDGGLLTVEMPVFLRALIPGYAYMPPGPFDSEQIGLFYVPALSDMDENERLWFQQSVAEGRLAGPIVHETYPGHHVQMSMANMHPSFIRKLQDDTFTLEGWALYCEEMMASEGYGGPDQMDRALDGIIFRAARAIVDIRLQLGEYSLEDAVAFMIKETGLPYDFVAKEVRRYAVEPTQPMSYIIGKREIARLRDDVRGVMGEAFTLGAFHNTVLGCGAVQPYLLRACVMSCIKQSF